MKNLAIEVDVAADRAVSSLRERSGDRLDYTEKSLELIEEILAEAVQYRTELPPHVVTGLVQELGSYILKVAHLRYGGSFFWLDDSAEPVLVVGEPQRHIAIATWGKVRSRLSGDEADNIPFFYRGFSQRIASAPAGTRVLIT